MAVVRLMEWLAYSISRSDLHKLCFMHVHSHYICLYKFSTRASLVLVYIYCSYQN